MKVFLTSIRCFNFNLRFPLLHSRSHTYACLQSASIPHNKMASLCTHWIAYKTWFLRPACTSWNNNNSGKLLPPLFSSCIEHMMAPRNSRRLLTELVSDNTRHHCIILLIYLKVATCISFLISHSQKLLQEPESTAKSSTVCTCIQFNYIFLDFLEFKCLGHDPYFVGQDALLGSFYWISHLFNYLAILVLS